MPIEFFDYASVFLNSMCLLAGGIACAYLSMNTFFARRHAPYLFFAYFVLKMFAVATADTMRWFSLGDATTYLICEIIIAMFGVLVITVTYYTWDGSLAKVGLMGMLTDFIAGFAMVGAVLVSNVVFGVGPVLEYAGKLHPASAVSGCLMVVFFLLLLQIAKPLGRAIVNYSFKYERLVLIFVFANIVFSAVSRVSGVQDDTLADFTGPYMMMLFCVPLVIAFIVIRLHEERKRKLYLARCRYLMSACDDAIRSQSLFLEKSRDVLDGLAERIDRVESDATRKDLRRYLDDLQSVCDSLRFGTYSDNPVLDTVLMRYEEIFKAMGMGISFRVSPLSTASERVAIAAQELLEWAARLVSSADGVNGSHEVQFRAFRRANKIFLELSAPREHPSVSHQSWLARRLLSGATLVSAKNENGMATVRLMLEEVSA